MIGEYCRNYRMNLNLTLNDVGGFEQVKNLSAFEHGRSSNIDHLVKYIKLSASLNDEANFIHGLFEVVKNG